MEKKSDIEYLQSDNPFYDVDEVVSSTECTGLIQRAQETAEQARANAELYSIHISRN